MRGKGRGGEERRGEENRGNEGGQMVVREGGRGNEVKEVK